MLRNREWFTSYLRPIVTEACLLIFGAQFCFPKISFLRFIFFFLF